MFHHWIYDPDLINKLWEVSLPWVTWLQRGRDKYLPSLCIQIIQIQSNGFQVPVKVKSQIQRKKTPEAIIKENFKFCWLVIITMPVRNLQGQEMSSCYWIWPEADPGTATPSWRHHHSVAIRWLIMSSQIQGLHTVTIMFAPFFRNLFVSNCDRISFWHSLETIFWFFRFRWQEEVQYVLTTV